MRLARQGTDASAGRLAKGSNKENMVGKVILWVVGAFALIGILVVAGCFKLIF